MLETRDLTKIYNENVFAVNKLNLKVDDGEIYVVLGANGEGGREIYFHVHTRHLSCQRDR